jgi:hypothetical protein
MMRNPIALTLPKPHVAQQHVIDEASRFNVLCCGRRFGKTQLGEDRLIQAALIGKPVAWFAPTYKLAAPVFRELQSRLQPVTVEANQQERRMELRGGGSIEVWSLDSPDAGRGRSYARVVIDEAAIIPDLEQAWNEGVRPMLTDHAGDAWFMSTPRGVANYFHTLYQRGQDPQRPDWASWQMPTIRNPYIQAAEVEAARKDMTDLAFAQEYLAQFVSWEGQVFRRIHDAVSEPDIAGAAVAIAVDWARTGDYTVFIAIDGSGRVIAIDRFRGIEYALQRARLHAFWRNTGGQAFIIAEANNMGGPLIEALRRENLPVAAFTTTNATKAAAIDSLALAFETGAIKIPDHPVLIGELQAFEAKPLPSGLMRYAAPEGLHDDTVITLALCWQGYLLWRQDQERARCIAALPEPVWDGRISPI